MSQTKIEYEGGKGFWINEVFVQLAFHFIYDEMLKPSYVFTNKPDLLYDCLAIINGHRSGVLVLNWDDDLEGAEDEQQMILLLTNVVATLRSKGAYIPAAELQAMPTEDAHWLRVMDKDFPVAELVRICEALIQLLRRSWEGENDAMEIVW